MNGIFAVKDVYDYFRAILSKQEKSVRALELTKDALRLNAANYTVWQYRWVVSSPLETLKLHISCFSSLDVTYWRRCRLICTMSSCTRKKLWLTIRRTTKCGTIDVWLLNGWTIRRTSWHWLRRFWEWTQRTTMHGNTVNGQFKRTSKCSKADGRAQPHSPLWNINIHFSIIDTVSSTMSWFSWTDWLRLMYATIQPGISDTLCWATRDWRQSCYCTKSTMWWIAFELSRTTKARGISCGVSCSTATADWISAKR